MQEKTSNTYGKLILRSVPNPRVEEKVAEFLSRIMKKLPEERIRAKIRKPPVVLAKKVSEKNAALIISQLEKLGASAVFVPLRPGELKKTASPQKAPRVVETPVQIVPPPDRLRKKWLRTASAMLLLLASLSFFAYRLHEAFYRPPPPELVFRPLTSAPVSVIDASSEDLRRGVFIQYRFRPDARLVRSFAVLAERYGDFHGFLKDPGFGLGKVKANSRELMLPLMVGDEKIDELVLPLPLTFGDAVAGLDQWRLAMDQHLKKEGGPEKSDIVSGSAPKTDSEAAADPMALLESLEGLQRTWNRSGPSPGLLRAASRRYALLLTLLFQDRSPFGDDLTSFALALTAACRPNEDGGSQRIERALIARAMGYGSYEKRGAGESFQDRLLLAFLRGDAEAVASMAAEGGVLADYLLLRLYRQRMKDESADEIVRRLLNRDPHFYPAMADAVFSGNLTMAKRCSVLFPVYLFSEMEAGPLPSGGPIGDWTSYLDWFSGEPSQSDLSIARFESVLQQKIASAQHLSRGILFDAERAAAVWRFLYLDALYLRYRMLSERWNKPHLAKAFADLLAEKNAGHPLVLSVLAKSAQSRQEPEAAFSHLQTMMQNPQSPAFLLAWVYDGIESDERRIQIWPEVFERLDGRPSFLVFSGASFHHLMSLDLAEKFTSAAVAFDPRLFEGYERLARIKGMDAPLRDALQSFPDEPRLLLLAGGYYAEKTDAGTKKTAFDLFQKANRLLPENRRAFKQSVKMLRDLGRQPEAFVEIEAFLKNGSPDREIEFELSILLAKIYLEIGDPGKAMKAVAEQVRVYRAEAFLVAAQASEAMGNLTKANEFIRLAAMRSGGDKEILLAAAAFFWRRGNDLQAAAYLADLRAQGGAPLQYEELFARSLSKANFKRLRSAAEALAAKGAGFEEIHRLAVYYAGIGKTEIASDLLGRAPAADALQEMERTVSRYVLIGLDQGENRAMQFLADSVPSEKGRLLCRVLYERGLFNPILGEFVLPEFHPAGTREHVRLYQLIAWMALGKESRAMGSLLERRYNEPYKPEGKSDHPLQQIEAVYHAAGRYLLDKITEEELLKVSSNTDHRCIFAYFIGLSSRLKKDYRNCTRWYQVCRSTLARDRLEYRWATRELARWQKNGSNHRDRLWQAPFGQRLDSTPSLE
ncbi:MAG: hypothetical protein K9K88_10155 [Desulfobacterales bacterium]|nr:hypothetical protein [Desulfobacterales bacterium]